MLRSTSSMTTPRPTADLVTSPPNLPHAPATTGDLPDWLPDESTLNRLAGEFFAALPGAEPAGRTAPAGGAGDVDHAPRVDVPARASTISQVPGDTSSDVAAV